MKKSITLFFVAIMLLGLATTGFADNNQHNIPTETFNGNTLNYDEYG